VGYDRKAMRVACLILLLLYAVACGLASAADPEQEVREAEKVWASAVMRADAAALEQILDDQLIYAHSTGVIESKAEYLGRLRRGAQKYDLIEHRRLTVKLHGAAAVAHSEVRMTGQSNQQPFDDRLMMLHLWVQRDGRWRLAAHQTTRLK